MAETDKLRECVHCGATLGAEQLICAQCGEAQRRVRRVRCRQCGTVNSRSQQVCVACGEPLRGFWIQPVLIALSIAIGLVFVLLVGTWLRGLLGPAQPATGTVEQAPSQVAAIPVQVLTFTPRPSVTPSPTPISTAVPSSSPSPTPTWTPTQTRSPTPTRTRVDTPTSSATPTPTDTSTPTPSPSPTTMPTETFTPTPTATPTPIIHVVEVGDTLYDIAATYGTTVQAIMEANGLTSTRLNIGQQLIIPLATATPEPQPTQS